MCFYRQTGGTFCSVEMLGDVVLQHFSLVYVLLRRGTPALKNWILCKNSFQSMAPLLISNDASPSTAKLGLVTFELVFSTLST